MKILSIRGRNLASLSEAFDIDFTVDPLASAGLFAITGPTGSGKSTLLDALCLALYGETPRLVAAGQTRLPDVNGETITSGDARAILRRGTGEGYAEVDFVGIDGVPYRARWVARRARGKGAGRLQNVEMSLARIADGQDMGGRTLSEVKRETEARIGLSFTQFTRAVLLAQNEFATFLKSGDNERAELLEMLTGSERFSDISRRAYQRTKDELARLEQLQARLADQLPLNAEERNTLEADLVAASNQVVTIEQRRNTLEAWLRWHATFEKAVADENTAQAMVVRSGEARDAASDRRAALGLVEAVQPARSLAEDCRRLAGESAAAVTAGVQSQEAFAVAEAAVQAANADLANSRTSLEQAEQASAQAAPLLVRAHALAAQIDSLKPGHAEARGALEKCEETLDHISRTTTEKQTAFASLQEDLHATRTWLSGHAIRQTLAVEWPRWDILLKQASTMLGELSEGATALQALAIKESQAAQTFETSQAAQVAQDAAASAAAQVLEAANVDVAHFDREALVARRVELESERERIVDATACWTQLSDLIARRQAVAARSEDTRKAMAENAAALAEASAAKPARVLSLANAERALRLAREASSENVEALRATLEHGASCPVCGATEHPWATHDPGLRAALAALELDKEDAQQALEAVTRQLAAAEATAEHLTGDLSDSHRMLAELTEACSAAQVRWDDHPLAAKCPDADERNGWLLKQGTANRETLDALAAQEKALRDAESSRDAAQRAASSVQQALAQAVAAATAAAAELQRLRQARMTAQEGQEALQRQLNTSLDQLDAPFPGDGWRDTWQASPQAFHRVAREQSDEWLAKQQHVATQEADAVTLQATLKEMAEAVESATTHLAAARTRFATIDGNIAAKEKELQAVFEGRSAAQVESTLVEVLAKARRGVDEKQSLVASAGQAHAKAAEALEQRKAQARALTEASASADRALHDWLAGFNASRADQPGVDSARLATLLVHDAQWIQLQREELSKLDVALAEAKAVLKNLTEARETQQAARPCEEPANVLHLQLESTKADLAAANDRKSALALTRAQDDERRSKHAAIADDLRVQEAKTRTWSQISEMIGSADGKKFRNIAQQITLDVLLGYANHHLVSLARRYRLERIAETLDLMVIDQDMADEVRSVHSLSGGESFLVSLALALGLASLSSHRVKVESLFIDEGFGSLDADALRVAMDALDGLQAQGRKVGVISHVQEMTERIGTQIRIERQSGGKSRMAMVLA